MDRFRSRVFDHSLAHELWLCILIAMTGCNQKPMQSPGSVSPGADPTNTISIGSLVNDLNMAVERDDFDTAESIVRELMIREPENFDFLKTAAFIQGRKGNPRQAAEILAEAVFSGNNSESLIDLALRANLEAGSLFESVELLRHVVRDSPQKLQYRRSLIGFLGEAQLLDEIPEHLIPLIQARQFDAMLLETVVLPGRRFSSEQLQLLASRNPTDERLRIGDATMLMDAARFDEASKLLKPIVDQHPDFAIAGGMLLRSLAMREAWQELATHIEARESLSSSTADGALAACRLHLHQGDVQAAILAAFLAAGMHPDDPATLTELTTCLNRLRYCVESKTVHEEIDRSNLAVVRRRSLLANLLHHATGFAHTGHKDPGAAHGIASTMLDLGRNWEAEAWSAIATSLIKTESDPKLQAAIKNFRSTVVAALRAAPQWQTPIDGIQPPPEKLLASLPLGRVPPNTSAAPNNRDRPHVTFAFRESAAEFEMNAGGYTSSHRFGPMVSLADSLGCGIGTLDFDLDGKADLCFAAAGDHVCSNQNEPASLLRHIGEQYVDVTSDARVGDTGFGQGVAIADFNQDGFHDIYLLNFGVNRCYRNNGDGTFSDVTDQVGLAGKPNAWSTSAAWMDLNEDGYLDLVVCNYIDDHDRVTKTCVDSQGRPAPCSPLDFPAAGNQFFAGTASGRWIDVSQEWSDGSVHGRSLGIIAGRLDGRRPGVLIANDMTANEYLVFEKSNSDHSSVGVSDQSFLSGLAVDGRGRTQASMGIASGDFDFDGDLDFYMTGFEDEYNVMYRQESPGTWVDCTAASGILVQTLPRVGFGAKAVDLNNDGLLEIFVANGHVSGDVDGVDDYAQTPDLFVETTAGRYSSATITGDDRYLTTPHVGRCVLPLDVNDDGNLDLLITHVTEKPALLINRSPSYGHDIVVELVAITSARDASGATIRFQLEGDGGNHRVTAQNLAGGGFMVSPQPVFRVAIPDGSQCVSATIEWPNGSTQDTGSLTSGKHYLCVEGQIPHER